VTGVITTVAGNGTQGFSGDAGAATAAQLYVPSAVAVDGAGNLYIAEEFNYRIRKVTAATGLITTVAGNGTCGFAGDGGPATAAKLCDPMSVAVDGAGNLYIADSHSRIRKVTAATGLITTVAGSGTSGFSGDGGAATAAQINQPWGVAVDGAGNLYIADSYNYRIRKVTAATGLITTVAGSGTSGFGGDGGAATAAQMSAPLHVAVDGAGNLYITDTDRIRKVTAATGVITTVAGTGAFGYSGEAGPATAAQLRHPGGVAVDGAGNLYIADTNNDRIRKVTAATGLITTVAGSTSGFGGDGGAAPAAQLDRPRSVAVDGAGNLYIADTNNERIRKVTAATTPALVMMTVAGNGTLGFSGDGGVATAAQMSYPRSVAVDGAGNLYIADYSNCRIRTVTATTGLITTVAGNGTCGLAGDGGAATAASLHDPFGVAVDGAGNLYIADSYNSRIRKVTAATGLMTTAAGSDGGFGSGGFAGDGGSATAARLSHPDGVAVDGAGNLYIADTLNCRIRTVTAATGLITTAAGNGTCGFGGDGGAATAANLRYPDGIAVDGAGNLYIADTVNVRIRKVTAATGIITTIAGTGTQGYSGEAGPATAAQLGLPTGVAVDGAGNLYIADTSNSRIRKVTRATGLITTVAGSGSYGFGGDGGAALAAQLNGPYGVAVDATGSLYIADNGCCIREAVLVVAPSLPTMTLDKTSLTFAAATAGAAFSAKTSAQTVRLTQTGAGTVTWTATSTTPWLVVTPTSGTGSAMLTISTQFASGLAATQTAVVNLAFSGAGNTAGPVSVTLNTVSSTAAASPPFGSFDTPAGDATVLAGSIALTGWTLDNIGVKQVEIWRDLQPAETTPPGNSTPGDPRNGKIYIANGTFVNGARPDVEALYPTTPANYRAGWGYLMLTWGLFGQGNGTYKFYAFGVDQEGNTATIGTKTVVISNNTATKPFGSIDTPAIGGDASGPNFGWGLTPKVNGAATCKIQPSGVQYSIDSGPLQPVVYGDARTDIAGAFPGFSNTAAAGGHAIIDWATLTNGSHTIGWLITDDCNRADGVGSRFFNVTTGTALKTADTAFALAEPAGLLAASRAAETESDVAITVARGYGELPEIVDPGATGSRIVEIKQGERVELRTPRGYEAAYQLGPGGQRRALPVGSTWDAASAIFSWQPAAGFLGRYRIVFSNGSERISVRVIITP
jgi:sugar lactone lactonase YvrE